MRQKYQEKMHHQQPILCFTNCYVLFLCLICKNASFCSACVEGSTQWQQWQCVNIIKTVRGYVFVLSLEDGCEHH